MIKSYAFCSGLILYIGDSVQYNVLNKKWGDIAYCLLIQTLLFVYSHLPHFLNSRKSADHSCS
jgi:hypothetical protein